MSQNTTCHQTSEKLHCFAISGVHVFTLRLRLLHGIRFQLALRHGSCNSQPNRFIATRACTEISKQSQAIPTFCCYHIILWPSFSFGTRTLHSRFCARLGWCVLRWGVRSCKQWRVYVCSVGPCLCSLPKEDTLLEIHCHKVTPCDVLLALDNFCCSSSTALSPAAKIGPQPREKAFLNHRISLDFSCDFLPVCISLCGT